MAFKIPVKDRVSTYPGRVILIPVSGQENTYDMTRADMPIEEGTPINKKLLDNKAYILTEDVTVYVSSMGDDTTATGGTDAPFATIQAAVDALPKDLGGYTATIDIDDGLYEEQVKCKGFTGGKLVFGNRNKDVTIRGAEFDNCTYVDFNCRWIDALEGSNMSLLKAMNGSNVHIGRSIGIDGWNNAVSGVSATYNSSISSINGVTVTVNNCGGNAVVATNGSIIALYHIVGSGHFSGLYASVGGVISYESSTIESYFGDEASGGGRILTGGMVGNLVNVSLE